MISEHQLRQIVSEMYQNISINLSINLATIVEYTTRQLTEVTNRLNKEFEDIREELNNITDRQNVIVDLLLTNQETIESPRKTQDQFREFKKTQKEKFEEYKNKMKMKFGDYRKMMREKLEEFKEREKEKSEEYKKMVVLQNRELIEEEINRRIHQRMEVIKEDQSKSFNLIILGGLRDLEIDVKVGGVIHESIKKADGYGCFIDGPSENEFLVAKVNFGLLMKKRNGDFKIFPMKEGKTYKSNF